MVVVACRSIQVVREWARLRVRFARHASGTARPPDVVTELASYILRERARLVERIKELDPIQKAWSAWKQKVDGLASTQQLCDTEKDADMRELAVLEVASLGEETEHAHTELRRAILARNAGSIGSRGAIIELKQGVGGQESCLFLGEMLRMYTKYSENRAQQAADANDPLAIGYGWDTELLSSTPVDVSTANGSSDALREAILQVHGAGAFAALRYEGGVHRVQRIPSTQNLGKLQTSTIAILVLPMQGGESDQVDDIVDPKDVKVETMRARGAGGQHVNRTESAVRLTHLPTKINVSMQDYRSQHQNRAKAWEVLRARLTDRKLRADAAENRAMRRSQVSSADRSERVRTYNFPQDRVTDHRVNISLSGISSIMEGDDDGGAGLTYLIQELKGRDEEQQLEGMLETYKEAEPTS